MSAREKWRRGRVRAAAPLSCRGVADHVFGDAALLHLSVKRRPADAEFAGGLGHLSAVVGEGEANGFGFDLFELAHIAAVVDEPKRMGIARLDGRRSEGGRRRRIGGDWRRR